MHFSTHPTYPQRLWYWLFTDYTWRGCRGDCRCSPVLPYLLLSPLLIRMSRGFVASLSSGSCFSLLCWSSLLLSLFLLIISSSFPHLGSIYELGQGRKSGCHHSIVNRSDQSSSKPFYPIQFGGNDVASILPEFGKLSEIFSH